MQKQSAPAQKRISVPKTEKSQAQDKALRKYLIICGAGLAAIVIIGGYLIFWLGGKYIHQSNVTKAQSQLINNLETKQKNLQALKPNYEAITTKGANGISDADLILRAMPTTEDYASLIATLERIGLESGVKVTNVSQVNTSAAPAANTGSGGLGGNSNSSSSTVTPFVFTVNVEGSYTGILEFLKKTEQSARVVNFNSMSLNGKTGNISANLTMTTFFKPDANINSTFVPLR